MKSYMWLFLICACSTADGIERIAVDEPNDLGVTSIEVSRSADAADRVFQIRGLDAAEHEVASFRLHIGTIAGLRVQRPVDLLTARS